MSSFTFIKRNAGANSMDRREFLYGLNTSLGSIAFSAMLADEAPAQDTPARVAHFPSHSALRSEGAWRPRSREWPVGGVRYP